MSWRNDHEHESPARFNRVLAQARRRQQGAIRLTPHEVVATARLELGEFALAVDRIESEEAERHLALDRFPMW